MSTVVVTTGGNDVGSDYPPDEDPGHRCDWCGRYGADIKMAPCIDLPVVWLHPECEEPWLRAIAAGTYKSRGESRPATDNDVE
jgi:hypothetical protein